MKKKRMSSEIPPINKRIENKNSMKKETSKTQMIRIDEADHEWIKNEAYEKRLTMKDMVSLLIGSYLYKE